MRTKPAGVRLHRRIRGAGLAALLLGAAAAGCGIGSGSAEPTATTKTSTAKADFGAVAGISSFNYTGQVSYPDGPGVLLGPHFSLRVDRIALTDRLTQFQADEFVDTGSWELPDYDTLKAAAGHRFLLIHGVPPKSAPALPEYEENNAPPEKVKASVRVGGTTIPLPADLRKLAPGAGWATMLVSIPAKGTPVLQVEDAGRVQSLDLTTGHRGKDAVPAFYPLRTESDGVGLSAQHLTMRQETSVEVSADVSLQPYTEDDGWAPEGKAWLVLSGDCVSFMRDNGGHPVSFEAVLDVGKSFSLDTGHGPRLTAKGIAGGTSAVSATSIPDPVTSASTGPFDIRFAVPDTFRGGTLHFTPRGTFTLDGKHTSWSPSKTSGPAHISMK